MGYQTNTAEMASVAGKIDSLASPVSDQQAKVAAPAVTAKDFGRSNQGSSGAYTTGIANLAKWLGQHAEQMHTFADRLRSSNTGYQNSESTNSKDINHAGGQA